MITYIPSISENPESFFEKLPNTEKDISWFTNNSPWKYPYFLISYVYGKKYNNLHDDFNAKDSLIIGDSGGFTNATKGLELDANDVVEWMNNNVDIGFILDYPTYKVKDSKNGGQVSYSEFTKKLNDTEKNINIMINKQSGFDLYGILQGGFIQREKEWENMLHQYDLGGLGIGGWKTNFERIIDIIYRNLDYYKNYHLLGVSKLNSIAKLLYLSEKFDVNITFDSISYKTGRLYRRMRTPDLMGSFQFGRSGSGNLSGKFCDCPYCTDLNDISIFYQDGSTGNGNSIYGWIIDMHNLYWMVKNIDTLKVMVKEKDNYISYMRRLGYNDVIKFIEIVDRYANGNPVKSQTLKVDIEDYL